MDLTRRSLFVGAGAVIGTSVIPLAHASQPWKSPLVAMSDFLLHVDIRPFLPGTYGSIGASILRAEELPGRSVRSIVDAEERIFGLFSRAEHLSDPSDEEMLYGAHRLIRASNRVAKCSRRGRGDVMFAAHDVFERLGFVTADQKHDVGRWQRYTHPLMDKAPQLRFYGTKGHTILGDDMFATYKGSGDFDALAVVSDKTGPHRLILQDRWEDYGIRFVPPRVIAVQLGVTM